MANDPGDFRPRGGQTPQPDNTLAGADNVHPDRRVDVPREISPMTMDFEDSPMFMDFRPAPVDADDLFPSQVRETNEFAEEELDPKDLSVLEYAISSELPTQTENESPDEKVSLVHAERDSTQLKETAPSTPPSSPPPNRGLSKQPAKT